MSKIGFRSCGQAIAKKLKKTDSTKKNALQMCDSCHISLSPFSPVRRKPAPPAGLFEKKV